MGLEYSQFEGVAARLIRNRPHVDLHQGVINELAEKLRLTINIDATYPAVFTASQKNSVRHKADADNLLVVLHGANNLRL